MNTEYNNDRVLLRFAEEVITHFAFLETKGFRCLSSEATLVQYGSGDVRINIHHGRQSYEISLHIENMLVSNSYSFSELLRLIDNERGEQYRDYAAQTVQGVAEGVRQLADLLRECVDAGILDDIELFCRLKLQRDEWAKNYALETQLEQVRSKAESAWTEKNFGKVIEVLTPFQEHLTPSDLKRLGYAKKQIGTE